MTRRLKFIRFAQWRINKTGHGVLAFVTNHVFGTIPTFGGDAAMQTFDDKPRHGTCTATLGKERSPDGGTDENILRHHRKVSLSAFVKAQKQRHHEPDSQAHARLWGGHETAEERKRWR